MLRTGDPAPDAGGRSVAIDTSDARAIRLPDGFSLFNTEFAREGADLVAIGPDGGQVSLRGFFAVADPPELLSQGGARISGELVAGLARPEAPVQLWEALFGPGPAPVGIVDTVNGSLGVARADGTRVELGSGDAVFSGDIVETGPDATAGITLADAVLLGIGPASRLVVISSGPGAETPINLAVEQGAYAFACGPSPRPLVVDGPAGRIEADGAQFVLTYRADGSLEVILLPDGDGSVGGLVFTNGAGAASLEWPYQWLTASGDDALPQILGVLGIDEIVAGYGQVLHGLPAGCTSALPLAAANAATDADDLSAAALEALVEFETGAGGEDSGDAPAPAERIVVTLADPLVGGTDPFAATTTPSPTTASRDQADAETSAAANGPNTTNEQILQSLEAPQPAPPRPTFPEPPPTADPPIAVPLTVADWSIPNWMTLVPQYPSHRDQQEFYRVLDGGYDEPEPFVSTPLPSQVVRTFTPSDGAPMVLMAAGPLGSPFEIGRGVEIYQIEDSGNPAHPDPLGLPMGTLANEIAGADPTDGAVMWATRTVAAGTTIRFDWMFDGRDEPSFDDFAAFTVAGTVAGVHETSVYELARNADVGGFGASGWRTSEWTFEPADGSATTLTLGFVVMNDGDDANEPRLLIDNLRIDTPVGGDVQPLGDPQSKTLGTLATYGPVPTASDDAVSTNEDAVLAIAGSTLLANDHSPTGVQSLSVTAVTANAATVGGVTLGSGGAITYDPGNHFDGLSAGATAADTFGYTITDVNGATATATVTVTIVGVNDAPEASADAFTTDEDSPVAGNVLADNGNGEDTDVDGAALTVTAINGIATNVGGEIALASGALLTVGADGAFTYDPNSRFEGLLAGDTATDTFTYTVDDGDGGTDTAGVTVTVTGVNDPPTAGDDVGETNEDKPIDIAVTANDSDPEGAAPTVSAINDGATIGVVTLSGAGLVSYDPAGRFDWLAAGETATDTFGYTIDDGSGGTDTATVTVTVTGVNDTPTAADDTLSTDEDNAITIAATTLLANDADPDTTDTLTVTAVDGGPATTGTAALDPEGTITYDPGEHFHDLAAGTTATDTFTYTISDGHGGTATATATVEISGVNDAPIAQDDMAMTDEHSAVRIAARRMLENDIDPDTGETLRLRVVDVDATATTGTVALNVDGSVTYDPDGRFAGLAFEETATDTFTYTIADGSGGTATAMVTVTIEGRNEATTPQGELIASFEETGTSTLPPEWDRIQPVDPGSDVFQPVSVDTGYVETDGRSGSFAPSDGGRMAVLEAFGSFEDPVTPVADFLGVPAAALPRDADFSDPQDGAAMKTTILVNAGDEISFDWMFDGRESEGDGIQAFNDFAVLTVAGATGTQVFKLADVRTTGDFGASGWRTSKYLATAGGELTIGFAVMNDEVSHGLGDARNSRLLVDNVRINRELVTDYQLLEGQPGDPFQTWVQAPTAGDDTVTVSEDAAVTIEAADLLVNDLPPAVGGTIGIIDVDADLAVGEVARNADGTITYDPRGLFDHLGGGETVTESFLYTIAADNGGTATARVEMTITGVNDAPVAADDALATDEDSSLAGNVLADNGAGGDDDAEGDTLTVTRINGVAANVGNQIALASGALLTVAADGTLAYDPGGSFDALKPGETETDSFTYTVDDGNGGADTATVTLTITGVNDAPAAIADAASTTEDAAVVIAPAGNDTDPEGDTLSVTAINSTATIGVVALNPDGTVDYDPRGRFDSLAQGQQATDSFAYTLEDGAGGIASGTVAVTVTGLNDVPMATLSAAATDEDGTVTMDVLAGASDPDVGDTLSVSALDASATTGTVTLNPDGTITYDPDGRFDALTDGETAEDTFAYTVADDHGGTATQTVTVTINGVGGGPSTPGALLQSFETPLDANDTRGVVLIARQYNEPDGNHDQYLPTDGTFMAFLEASGAFPSQIESFLGLDDPFPADVGDSSSAVDGAALRVTVDVSVGDEISFDWMFDSNDIVTAPDGDFQKDGFNDFAVFAAEGQSFTLSDVRQTFNETGMQVRASGWRTSVYTAQSDGPLTIGFAVLNDETSGYDSHLLVDNVRLDREFGDGYQVVDAQAGGIFETVVQV